MGIIKKDKESRNFLSSTNTYKKMFNLRSQTIVKVNKKKKTINIDLLISRAKNGDTEAFSLIYDEFLTPIYRYIYYKVDTAVAEDLTEETFFKAWKNIKKYKKRKFPFSSWLFRIAHNLVIDYYRRHPQTEDLPPEVASEDKETHPIEMVEKNISRSKLKKALSTLPEHFQQIIILKYINELTNKEIACALNKTEVAIRVMQHRALSKLKAILEEKYGF